MGGSVDPYAVLRGHQSDVQALTFDHSEAHLITGYVCLSFHPFPYQPQY